MEMTPAKRRSSESQLLKTAILAHVLGIEGGNVRQKLKRLRQAWTKKLTFTDIPPNRQVIMRCCRLYGLRGRSQLAKTCDRHRYCPMCRAREVERILRECQGKDVLYSNYAPHTHEKWKKILANKLRSLSNVPGQVLISRSVTVRDGQIRPVMSFFYEKSDEARQRMEDAGMLPLELPKYPDSAAALLRPFHWVEEMEHLELEVVADFIDIAKTMRSSAPREWRDKTEPGLK